MISSLAWLACARFRAAPAPGREIPLALSDGAFEHGEIVRLRSMTFHAAADQLCADIRMSLVSWPKARWRLKVQLLDRDGREICAAEEVFENSGTVTGVPLVGQRSLRVTFPGRSQLSRAERFAVSIESVLKTKQPATRPSPPARRLSPAVQ